MGELFVLCLVVGLMFLYMLPSLLAWKNEKRNFAAILALNILLGWTLFGWVGALAWALCKDVEAKHAES